MAVLHQATLRPTKLELLSTWVPGRPWYQGPAGDLARVASYRFDDPAGAVGIETMLVQAGDGPIYQAPLTYRAAPLDGADDLLIGTTEHSVLGRRWVYDACGDPLYGAALASVIFGGVEQAEEYLDVDGHLVHRERSMTVTASGDRDIARALSSGERDDPTLITTDGVHLAVIRCLAGSGDWSGATLTGTWTGQATPVALAYASRR